MLQIGPSKAAVFANLIVVFASIFGIIFLDEKLISAHVYGGILVISGVYLTTQKSKEYGRKNSKIQ